MAADRPLGRVSSAKSRAHSASANLSFIWPPDWSETLKLVKRAHYSRPLSGGKEVSPIQFRTRRGNNQVPRADSKQSASQHLHDHRPEQKQKDRDHSQDQGKERLRARFFSHLF